MSDIKDAIEDAVESEVSEALQQVQTESVTQQATEIVDTARELAGEIAQADKIAASAVEASNEIAYTRVLLDSQIAIILTRIEELGERIVEILSRLDTLTSLQIDEMVEDEDDETIDQPEQPIESPPASAVECAEETPAVFAPQKRKRTWL